MKKNLIDVLLKWLLIAASAALTILLASQAAWADIVIGIAGPLKGPYAGLGEEIRRGVAQAVNDINATGGILGQKLSVQSQDDGCDARRAVTAAEQLMAAQAKLVVGHYCSIASVSAAPIYGQAGVMMITPSATLPQVTEPGAWNVFRLVGRDDAQGQFAGAYVGKAYAGKRVAIIHDGSTAGTLTAQAFKVALNNAGTQETLFTTFKTGHNDYPDLVNQILSAQIEVIYLPGPAAEAGNIIRELKDLSSPAQLIGNDSLLVEQFWAVAGTSGEGTLASLAADALKVEEAKPVIAAMQRSGGIPVGHTLNAYAAVQAYAEAARATNSLDNQVISQWLKGGNKITSVVGPIHFDARGDLTQSAFSWYKWSAGKFSEVQLP